MQHQTNTSYDTWIGRNAYDNTGTKVGEITDVFYDDQTGRPEWLTVKTGLFKGNTFVPIHGSSVHHDDEGGEDNLRLAFDKEMIQDAPRIDAEGHMTPTEEQELWSYYGYDYGTDTTARRTDFGYGDAYSGDRADKDFQVEDQGTVEAEATIHNQEAQVVEGTEKVRLRKYQRTEMVPVTKEEVRVERVSDDDTKTETIRSGQSQTQR